MSQEWSDGRLARPVCARTSIAARLSTGKLGFDSNKY